MAPLFETVTDLVDQADVLARRPYGVIEMVDGRFRRVLLRPYPKMLLGPEALVFGAMHHRYRRGDRLLLYYNQPWRFRNFLALKYAISARETSMVSIARALDVLDEIARLKRVDGLLGDVSNWRISPRLLARFGWQPHCPSRWHRHYVKRFYGDYPPRAAWIGEVEPAGELMPCASGQ